MGHLHIQICDPEGIHHFVILTSEIIDEITQQTDNHPRKLAKKITIHLQLILIEWWVAIINICQCQNLKCMSRKWREKNSRAYRKLSNSGVVRWGWTHFVTSVCFQVFVYLNRIKRKQYYKNSDFWVFGACRLEVRTFFRVAFFWALLGKFSTWLWSSANCCSV